jgi:hypothetical protein
VADFYTKLFSGLETLGIGLSINTDPFDIGGVELSPAQIVDGNDVVSGRCPHSNAIIGHSKHLL